MSTSSGDYAKKRRVDGGGMVLSHNRDDGSARELMSAMNQLLDHSRSQMSSMARIQEEMKSVKEEMKNMQGEMKIMRDKCDKMEETLQISKNSHDSRFDDVKYKQKYHEILLKNQKWEYPASFPSIGSMVNDQERSLHQIKKETCDMRHGRCDGTIGIDGIVDANAPYDASFVPHWKEFADALEEYQHALRCLPSEATSKLEIHYVELPPDVLDYLSRALKASHFKSFSLRYNNFGQRGVQLALDYMQGNPKMEEFHFEGNLLYNNDNINQLCEIVKVHPSIHTIELDGCCGDSINGHDMLRSIMAAGRNTLKSIDLSCNAISTGGSMFIADYLAMNPVLQKLILWENNLVDEDANAIANALRLNTNLKYLNITGNDAIDYYTGWEELLRAEFDSTNLNSVADSNHTCYVQDYSDFNYRRIEDRAHISLSKAIRKMKIYSMLSSRNVSCSNVQYFDDIPVEFLPAILSSIHQYSEYHVGENAPAQREEDVIPLSIMFEVMRMWEKSVSVFESLSSSGGQSKNNLGPSFDAGR